MKKRIIAACLLFVALTACLIPVARSEWTVNRGQHTTQYYFSLMTNVTGGTFTWTVPRTDRNGEITMPFRIGSVRVKLPAVSTNAVSITYVRRYDEYPLYAPDNVTTNGDFISTNTSHSVTGSVVSITTNAFYSDTVTNTAATALDAAYSNYEDFPRSHYFMPDDQIIFTWTSTSSVPLIVDGLR